MAGSVNDEATNEEAEVKPILQPIGGFRSNANMFSTKPREFVVVATVPKGTGLDTVVGLERAPWFSTGGRWNRCAWCCP